MAIKVEKPFMWRGVQFVDYYEDATDFSAGPYVVCVVHGDKINVTQELEHCPGVYVGDCRVERANNNSIGTHLTKDSIRSNPAECARVAMQLNIKAAQSFSDLNIFANGEG